MIIYALMKANTMANATGGSVCHALTHDDRGSCGAALCGSSPGRRGMWSSYLGKEVTCPKCAKIIAQTAFSSVEIAQEEAISASRFGLEPWKQ